MRLCNINSLYLTGASEPKRFEHCLGVYHLANLWTQSRPLSSRRKQVVRAAALLHDLQTGPFGHSFQYVMEDNPFEQRFEHANIAGGVSRQFLQLAQAGAHFAGRAFAVTELLGDLASDVFAAIAGEGEFGPIISGTLDLDNLDNVIRLAFHMGLCTDLDRALPRALAPLLEPVDGGLAAPGEAHPLLERWFVIRRVLYEFLLLDRGEFAAKAMLTLAVELAVEASLLGPDDWRLTDEELLVALHDRSIGEHQAISQLVKRLRVGDLFECLGVWQTGDVSEYTRVSASKDKRDLERAIEEDLARQGGPKLRICLHYILDRKKTCRSLSYHDLNTREEKSVGYDSSKLLIGAFIVNARTTALSAHERQRVSGATKRALEHTGLGRLQKAPEPLAEPAGTSELFDI